MSRVKHYLDIDVLEAAKDRIRHVLDIFDSFAVCFSGGKDSLATLHLTRQIAAERGIDRINVMFRDEEFIPEEVISFVDRYRREPWVNMLWLCIPLASVKYVLGKTERYVQWDPNRRHIRTMPEWGHRLPAGDTRVFDQYTTDAYVAQTMGLKGKVALLTGIRAAESLMRWQSCTQKVNENYITASSVKGVSLVKPLYDWQEDDVFKLFYEEKIDYCPIYDMQCWAGSSLRVSTPCHAENAKNLSKIKRYSPVLYNQLIDVFPEMILQERYHGDLDRTSLLSQYGGSYDGVERYIREHITDPSQRQLALKRLRDVRVMGGNNPGAWPPDHVLKAVMSGAYKRVIQPVKSR